MTTVEYERVKAINGTVIHKRYKGSGPTICGIGNRNSRTRALMVVKGESKLPNCRYCGSWGTGSFLPGAGA